MLNGLFVFVVIASILLGASMGRMEEVTAAVLDSAGDAVTLAIGLVGVMVYERARTKLEERSAD